MSPESLILLIVYIAILALVVKLFLSFIPVPANVATLIWAIFALVVLLWVVRFLIGAGNSISLGFG